MTLVILRDPKASHGNVRENCVQTNSCILTKGSWLIMLSADLIWLCMSEVWEPLKATFLYLTHLFGNWVDGAEKQINSDISFCFVLLFFLLTCVQPHWQACLVAPRSKKKKKKFRNAQVQIAVCVISCLITSQIAISRKDKSVPSRSTRFRLDCFILRLTEKVILQVVFANCVIQKWAITYTNMTQKSFWPKAPYFPASSEQVIFKW